MYNITIILLYVLYKNRFKKYLFAMQNSVNYVVNFIFKVLYTVLAGPAVMPSYIAADGVDMYINTCTVNTNFNICCSPG